MRTKRPQVQMQVQYILQNLFSTANKCTSIFEPKREVVAQINKNAYRPQQ